MPAAANAASRSASLWRPPSSRRWVEEIFGWTKTVASFRKTRFRGQARTQLAAHLVAAAYNLLRIAKLMPA